MTIQSETSKITYAGNGSTTVFGTNFVFFNLVDVKVVLTNALNIETILTRTTHYSLSGGNGAAGNVTMFTAPAFGEKLTIYRDPPVTQETDYINGDSFDAESHEKALDKITQIIQSIKEKTERSLKIPISSNIAVTLPYAVPNTIFAWNDDASKIVNLSVSNIEKSFGGKALKDFGVVGDGLVDDTAALTLAFNSDNTIFCSGEIVKFSKVTANKKVKFVGSLVLQHDGSSVSGTSCLIFTKGLIVDHLHIRGNATDTIYDLINFQGSDGVSINLLEMSSTAQRANARGGCTSNASNVYIGRLKTKNIARPFVSESLDGTYLSNVHIGSYEIDTYIRGIKFSKTEDFYLGSGTQKNRWSGLTKTPGYNGILIEESRNFIISPQYIQDAAEHAVRIGGGGDGVTGFAIGDITAVDCGGCAFKSAVDVGALARGGTVGDINGINCGEGLGAGNDEVCRITRLRNVSIGIVNGSVSVSSAVSVADLDNVYIAGIKSNDTTSRMIKLDKNQDSSTGNIEDLYIGGVSGSMTGLNRSVIQIDYTAAGRKIKNFIIDNIVVDDYTSYYATVDGGSPTIEGIIKFEINVPDSAAQPLIENCPVTDKFINDITWGQKKYQGRADKTSFVGAMNFESNGALSLSSAPSSNQFGGLFSLNQTASSGDGVYGGSFIASRAGSARRGAGFASKQIGSNVYKQGLAFLVQDAGVVGTDALVEAAVLKPSGVLNLNLLPTYADDAAAGAGGLVGGDLYKTSTGALRIKL